MDIGERDILRLARMTRLALSDDESAAAAKALGDIVRMMAVLRDADVNDDDPMAHVGLQAQNGLRCREDNPLPGFGADKLLANAPARRGDLFAVPKVIE
ncbi:MAG: Asp-tRNA(Asn)/Glu-tRNA(Gln) amidotransferase subunit GatC [Gammaproteobacteria bacterium]